MVEVLLSMRLDEKLSRVFEKFQRELVEENFEYLEIKNGYRSETIPLYCEDNKFHMIYYYGGRIVKTSTNISM